MISIISIIDFIKDNITVFILLMVLNFVLVKQIIYKIEMYLNRFAREAIGKRKEDLSLSSRFKRKLFSTVDDIERRNGTFLGNIVNRNRLKLKLAGYNSNKALVIFLFCEFVLPLLLSFLVLLIHHNILLSIVLIPIRPDRVVIVYTF